ncbi:MAG: PAS domain S-box protein [Promethearchaeota archaeon]
MSLDLIKILMVDENPSGVALIEDLLKKNNKVKFKLEYCNSLSKGFKYIKKSSFDIILIDVIILGDNYVETIKKLIKSSPKTPIIILSPNSNLEMAINLINVGVQDCLVKEDLNTQSLWKSIIYSIQRKSFEQKSNESEKIFKTRINSAQDALLLIDHEGRIVFCNDAVEKMFGYKDQELKGKNVLELIAPKDYNITEKKLKESEEKYRNILESINEGYFEIDLWNNFTFFNGALCKSLGYSREELMNMKTNNLFDRQTSVKVYNTYLRLLQKREASILFDYPIIRKDGRKFYHESSVYLRYDSKGNIIGYKGFVRDVTERKKAEKLRKKFHQKLEKEVEIRTNELKVALEHQKLYLDQILKASHFKTEFLASMSHELRTPLNAIIGFTDLLLEGVYGQLNSEQLEFIKDIKESSNHLMDMISNILDISKIESGQISLKIDKIKIFDLIQHIISTLNPLCGDKDLKFEIKGLNKDQIILADRIKLKQIIYNLLSNAIKFTEKGVIIFEFLDKKDNWEFNVKDTGIGIAKEDFEIIFKEFKRVRSPFDDLKPGAGLGLALTKRLVNLHGGNISFKSKLGEGSTFTFYISKRIELYQDFSNVEQFIEL